MLQYAESQRLGCDWRSAQIIYKDGEKDKELNLWPFYYEEIRRKEDSGMEDEKELLGK